MTEDFWDEIVERNIFFFCFIFRYVSEVKARVWSYMQVKTLHTAASYVKDAFLEQQWRREKAGCNRTLFHDYRKYE